MMSTCKQHLRQYLDHLRGTVEGGDYVRLEHETNRLFDAYMTNNSLTVEGQSEWGVIIVHMACCHVGVCPPFDLPDYTVTLMKATRDRHAQKFTERVLPKLMAADQQYGDLLNRGIEVVAFIRKVFDESISQKKIGTYGTATNNRSVIHRNAFMSVIALWASMVAICASQTLSSMLLSIESINREIFHLFRVVGLELKPAAKPIFEQTDRILVSDSSRREPEFRRLITQVPHKDRLVSEFAQSRTEFRDEDWEKLVVLYARDCSHQLILAHMDRMISSVTTAAQPSVEGIETMFEVENIDYTGVDLHMFFNTS